MNGGHLAGVRVLDLSAPIGTYGARLLALLGADVVLVEPPEGDPYRRMGPYRRGTGPGAGSSLSFEYYQAGKRSIVLDLDASDDVATLTRLGAGADVVLISPVPDRPLPGFDPERGALAWANDVAIVCAVTPYGVTGPYARRRATHLTSFAQGGQMCRIGPVEGPPLAQPANIHWHLAGVHAAIAVVAALGVRDQVGGQFIDISAQEVEVYHDLQFEAYQTEGLRPGARTNFIGAPPTGNWVCADGVLNVAAHTDRHWQAFLEMLGHPEELAEPALADMAVRLQIYDGLIALIEPLMASRSRGELENRGQAAGLPVSALNSPSEFVADEQLAARDYWVDLGRPETGPLKAPGAPVRATPPLFVTPRPAPLRDEHGDELRREARTGPTSRAWSASATGALAGVRVVSFGAFVAGNVTAQILASLGAEVVKIEPRSRPESLRQAAYNYGGELRREPSGVSNTPMYASLSRGALGVALEMDHPEAREAFLRLVDASDMVIENFSAGVMQKWGCTYDDLRRRKPSVVMASLSGYGRTGPRAHHVAYASSIANFTGLTQLWCAHGLYTDYVTATHAVLALIAAHQRAVATGEGTWIDAAQIEAFAALGASLYLDPLVNGTPSSPPVNASDGSLFAYVVRCAGEDRWAAVEAMTLEDWNAVCRVAGRPDLQAATEDEARWRHDQLAAALEEWAAPRTALSVAHLLEAAGVPAAPVANNEEIVRDPQLHSRGFVLFTDNPDLGRYAYPGSPYRMSKTPGRFTRLGPRLGEHTRDVLRRWAGLDDRAIDDLIASGAAFDAGARTPALQG